LLSDYNQSSSEADVSASHEPSNLSSERRGEKSLCARLVASELAARKFIMAGGGGAAWFSISLVSNIPVIGCVWWVSGWRDRRRRSRGARARGFWLEVNDRFGHREITPPW